MVVAENRDRATRRLALVLACLATLLVGCRDRGVDLDSPQAVLVKRRNVKHRSIFDPARDLAQAPEVFRAKFRTRGSGNFVVQCHRAWAPQAADRFYNLVRSDFFKGVSFHRVVRGHLIQWGIHPNARVTESWRAQPIERDPPVKSNLTGYLAFGLDLRSRTRTTQIFVNLSDHPQYDRIGFTPFARVVEGMDAFSRIYGGYGETLQFGNERGVDAHLLAANGKRYLKRRFPMLDSIRDVELLED